MNNEIKSIVFPTDFSERANKAIGEVASLAKLLDAKLTVCNFYYRPIPKNSDFVDYENRMLHAREKMIEQEFSFLKEIFPDLDSPRVTFVKKMDSFVDGINELIKANQADIIMMGTKGAKGFDEFWGSKTFKVSQEVEIPVLALPYGASLQNIKEIGIATNFDPDTKFAMIGIVKQLANAYEAKINIVHVSQEETPQLSEKQLAVSVKVHEALNEVKHDFHYSNSDDVAQGLMDYCTEKAIQMVVVLPTERTFIEDILHTSVTKRLTHHLNLPLLILK